MSIINNNYTIIYNSDGYNIINNDEITEIAKIDKNNIDNKKSYQNDKNIIKVINKTNSHLSELPVDKLVDYLHR